MKAQSNIKSIITKVTGELIAEKGFHNVSVNEICSCANVSRTSFYAFFSSKKDVLLSIAKEAANIENIDTLKMMELENDFERILYLFHCHIDPFISHGVSYCIILYKLELDEQLGLFDFSNMYDKWYIKWIKNCQRNGIIRNTRDAQHLNHCAVQLVKALLLDWCIKKGNFDFWEESCHLMEEFYDVAPQYRKYSIL